MTRPLSGLAGRSAAAGGLLAVLVSLAFAVLVASITGMWRSHDVAAQSRVAISQARTVEGLAVNADAGLRGFLITGQGHFLQPWQSAARAFPRQAQRLVRVSASPGQRRLARQISWAGESYLRVYPVPLLNSARKGDPQARSVIATAARMSRADALRTQFARYEKAGAALIAARQRAADASASRAIVVASAGLAVSTGLIIAFNGYVLMGIVRPICRAAAATTRLAAGDLSVRLREGSSGEIGELARGFNAMAASVQESREQEQAARQRLRLLCDANRAVGDTLDRVRAAQNLVRVTVPRFADFATVDLAVPLPAGSVPSAGMPAPWRRVALGAVRSDPPLDRVGARITPSAALPRGRASGGATFVPDLGDSPGWRAGDRRGAGRLLAYGMHSLIAAPLHAHGVLIGAITFWRSNDRDPFCPDDLAIAREMAAKTGIALDNARRYDRDRATAVTLQRSLLPQQLPSHPAVQTAYRYLPADTGAGVGGDWCDVIPLSGARVALVVGDVVGHGIHAAAAMGRLRTAVRTLAAVDLPPDELLAQLDDVVIHLTGSDAGCAAAAGAGELAATCLYAVYDPVSCRASLASAGHPLPFVITPGRAAELITADPGPPLGIGGLPFETTELGIAPGSVLALYTDGLLESARRDIGQGLTELRCALSRPAASLDAVHDGVIAAMLTGRPADDVTLLLARTRALPASHVASWDIPADPAHLAGVRKLVTGQLEAWHMAALSCATTLVADELVTNAIRYGAPPIKLRLIRGATLICEVSDASGATPHLRNAQGLDEGGRGLQLVAHLTQRWGTRHHPSGKTIWCEQALPHPASSP